MSLWVKGTKNDTFILKTLCERAIQVQIDLNFTSVKLKH